VAESKAGLPDYTLHELRHTFASILIAQGELPTLVAKQMGHADPGVTLKTYTHLWQEKESIETARERLQEAMGGLI
jgi:integrase